MMVDEYKSRQRNKIIYVIVIVVVLILPTGIYTYMSHGDEPSDNLLSQETERSRNDNTGTSVVSDADLLKYEHTLIGDSKTVSNIIKSRPGGDNIDKIDIKIEESPYGIQLRGNDELTAKEIDAISKQVLKLVDDCEWVEISSSQFYSKVIRDGGSDFRVIN